MRRFSFSRRGAVDVAHMPHCHKHSFIEYFGQVLGLNVNFGVLRSNVSNRSKFTLIFSATHIKILSENLFRSKSIKFYGRIANNVVT